MIFSKRMVEAILAGRKTQTRRPMRPYAPPAERYYVDARGRTRRRPTARTVVWDGVEYHRPPMPPDEIAVQPGRGQRGIARLVVTDLSSQNAGDIDHFAARAEGFRTTDEFKALWVTLHENAVAYRKGVGRQDDDGIICEAPDDELLVARFDERHAATPVWVITFELATDVPRFLTPAARGDHDGDEHGYTAKPARALEPVEAVSVVEQAEISKEANHRSGLQRGWLDQQLLDEAQSLEERLAAARRVAKRRGVDVHAEVRLAERALRSIERKIAGRHAA